MLKHARQRGDAGAEKTVYALLNNNEKIINDLVDSEDVVDTIQDIILRRVCVAVSRWGRLHAISRFFFVCAGQIRQRVGPIQGVVHVRRGACGGGTGCRPQLAV